MCNYLANHAANDLSGKRALIKFDFQFLLNIDFLEYCSGGVCDWFYSSYRWTAVFKDQVIQYYNSLT